MMWDKSFLYFKKYGLKFSFLCLLICIGVSIVYSILFKDEYRYKKKNFQFLI